MTFMQSGPNNNNNNNNNNTAASEDEDDQIQKAIQMSLEESSMIDTTLLPITSSSSSATNNNNNNNALLCLPAPSGPGSTNNNASPGSNVNNAINVDAMDINKEEDNDLLLAIQQSMEDANVNKTSLSATSGTTGCSLKHLLRSTWSDKKEEEENKELFPPGVGLKNVGNTCYVNALIQTYFMIPCVLYSIMRQKSLIVIKDNNESQLQQQGQDNNNTVVSVTNNNNATTGESPSSLSEDVQMVESNVVNNINNNESNVLLNSSVNATMSNTLIRPQMDEQASKDFLLELQRLFSYLLLSNHKFVDPSTTLEKLKDYENKKYQIGEMEDLPEFNDLFLSRLEQGIDSIATDQMEEHLGTEFKSFFYGKSTVYVESQEKDLTPITKRTEETFNHLILPITPETKTFFDTFELCMRDDYIEYTTDLNFKTTARKTVWFENYESLPPVLFLQTSRVVLDQVKTNNNNSNGTNNQTGISTSAVPTLTKLHVPIKFPEILDLRPYMEHNREITENIRRKLKEYKKDLNNVEKELNSYVESFNNRGFGLIQALESSSDYLFDKRQNLESNCDTKEATDEMQSLSNAIRVIQKEQERISTKANQLKQVKEELISLINNSFKDKYSKEEFEKNRKYQLHSIIMHSGRSAIAGHYWSYVRHLGSPDNNTWLKFNDTDVTSVTTETVFKEAFSEDSNSSAYCVVYIDTERTNIFSNDFKNMLLSSMSPKLIEEVNYSNVELVRRIENEGSSSSSASANAAMIGPVNDPSKQLTPLEKLKEEINRETMFAEKDFLQSKPDRDYRVKSFINYLKFIANTVKPNNEMSSNNNNEEYGLLFDAYLLQLCYIRVYVRGIHKDLENQELQEIRNVLGSKVVDLAIQISGDEKSVKLLQQMREDYNIFRKVYLCIYRSVACISTGDIKWADAINYLAFCLEESKKISFIPTQADLIQTCTQLLELMIVGYFCDLVSFMQYDTSEPIQRIVDFCIKPAINYGTETILNYLNENTKMLELEYSNCFSGHYSTKREIENRLKNLNATPNKLYKIDQQMIKIPKEKLEDSYFVGQLEQSVKDFTKAKQILSMPGNTLQEYKTGSRNNNNNNNSSSSYPFV
ncbi:hypothetical protein ABK040_007550 [Willaertia magna]